jgi:hypothetical protein
VDVYELESIVKVREFAVIENVLLEDVAES